MENNFTIESCGSSCGEEAYLKLSGEKQYVDKIKKGINTFIIDQDNGEITHFKSFNVYEDTVKCGKWEEWHDFVEKAEDGNIVVVIGKEGVTAPPEGSRAAGFLNGIGATEIFKVKDSARNKAYALMFTQGEKYCDEKLEDKTVTVSKSFLYKERNKLEFIQYKQTTINAGRYEVNITQTLNYDNFEKNIEFLVPGKRINLEERDEHAIYPPSSKKGDYAHELPYIVLNDNKLAWLRSTDTISNEEKVPFLFLMVVKEGEMDGVFDGYEEKAPKVLPLRKIKWKDLASKGAVKSKSEEITFKMLEDTLVNEVLSQNIKTGMDESESIKNRFHYLQLKDEGLIEEDETVICLGAKREYLEGVLPSYEELSYLAHNRQLKDIRDNPLGDQKTVILSNRKIDEASNYFVFLVSLEDRYTNKEFNYYGADEKDYINFIVFRSWQFTHEGGKSFEKEIRGLSSSMFAYKMGDKEGSCIPLKHDLRGGGNTYSWYHGPLVAKENTDIPDFSEMDIKNADQLISLDKKNAMFDISYSAAWELGKLLCLENQNYAKNLIKWKKDNYENMAKNKQQKFYSYMFSEHKKESNQGHSDIIRPEDFYELGSNYEKDAQIIFNVLKRGGVLDSGNRVNHKIDISDAINALNFDFEEKKEEEKEKKREAIKKMLAEKERWTPYRWLESLALLHEVPFQYIIPTKETLPEESIKFFYLDRLWINSLLKGVFSVGDLMAGEDEHSSRSAGKRSFDLFSDATTGVIIRSKLISDFPGLTVEATGEELGNTEDIPHKNKLDILRHEKIAEDTLIVIFKGEIKYMDLYLKTDSLHYKLSPENKFKEPNGQETGGGIGKIPLKTIKSGEKGLAMDVKWIVGEMIGKIKGYKNAEKELFTSAQFGMQLLRGNTKFRYAVNEEK